MTQLAKSTNQVRPPTSSPNSANITVDYQGNNRQAVLNWLVNTMLDDCSLTRSNLSAVDANNHFRWRMSLRSKDHRVLFDREEDARMFSLAWGKFDDR